MASNLCYLACRDLDDFQSSQELLQFNLFQDLQGFQSDLRKRWYLDPGLYLKTLRLNEYTYADLLQDMHTYLFLIIEWEGGVVGPGGIWGRVQGVGSDHWGT